MATSWNYDATAHTITATFATVNGNTYDLSSNDPNSAFQRGTATGSTLTLTATGVATSPVGDFFDVYITEHSPDSNYVDANVFKIGTSSTTGETLDVTWTYNGTTGFTAEFAAPDIGHSYQAVVNYINGNNFAATSGGSQTGSADTTCTVTAGSAIDASTLIYLSVEDVTTFRVHATRIFTAGSSGTGSAGSSGSPFAGGGGGGGETTVPAFSIVNLAHDGSTISTVSPVGQSLKWTYRLAQSGGPGEAEWAVALSDASLTDPDQFAPYRTDWQLVMSFPTSSSTLIAGITTPVNTGSESSGVFGEVRMQGKDWLHYLEQPYPFDYAGIVADVATNQLAAPGQLFKAWSAQTQETIVGDLFDSISGYEDVPAFSPSYEGAGWSLTMDKSIAFGDNTSLLDLILDIGKLGPVGSDTYGFDMWCDPDLTVHMVAPRTTPATAVTPLYTLNDSSVVGPPLDWTNNGPLATDTVTFGQSANNTSRIGFDDYSASRTTYRRWVEFQQVNLSSTETIASAAAAIGHQDRFPQKDLKVTIRPDLLDPDDTAAGFRNHVGKAIAVNYPIGPIGLYHTIDANFWILEQSYYSPDGCNWLCDLTLQQIYDATDTPNP